MQWLINFWTWLFGTKTNNMLKADKMTDYLVNDPSTDMIIKVAVPRPDGNLRFKVIRKGDRFRISNVYVTMVKTINHAQNMLPRYLKRWAAVRSLQVVPEAGRMFNAYYDRRALKFFWDIIGTQKVYLADSTDVVAHELGHAILDAMRPDFWSVQALEIWAFHEAFADITSLVSIMQYKQVLEKVLYETGGDLRKPNIIGSVAEHIGYAAYGPGIPLRNANNEFVYTPPELLPAEAPRDKLAAECHSFGRIFLGAWYDLLINIYEEDKRQGKTPIAALAHASNVAYRWLLAGATQTPRVAKYHEAISSVITRIAMAENSPYVGFWKAIVEKRNLGRTQVGTLSDVKLSALNADVTQIGDAISFAVVKESKTIKLSDHMAIGEVGELSVNGHNLAELELEIPSDSLYVFTEDGMLVDEIRTSDEQALLTAQACVSQIKTQSSVSNEANTMWEAKQGKLTRTLIE